MRLKLDNECSMNFDPQRHPHLDHGCAVISYSSQGQTADRVLINVDTELVAKDLLNNLPLLLILVPNAPPVCCLPCALLRSSTG
jgi:hypothetical protein